QLSMGSPLPKRGRLAREGWKFAAHPRWTSKAAFAGWLPRRRGGAVYQLPYPRRRRRFIPVGNEFVHLSKNCLTLGLVWLAIFRSTTDVDGKKTGAIGRHQ